MGGKTFMLMAGGTGGHIFPALAVADSLRARGHHVIWLGSEGSMEERIVPQYDILLERRSRRRPSSRPWGSTCDLRRGPQSLECRHWWSET